jgi:hypothetical protein
VFNATFNIYNISIISWQKVLLLEETVVPVENHRPTACHWQTQGRIQSLCCWRGGLSYWAIFSIIDGTNCSPKAKGSLQDQRWLDIGRTLQSVNLIQSSLDCRANVEQFNHQCFERSAKICEPLEVKKPRICGRQIMREEVSNCTFSPLYAKRCIQG